MSTRGMIIGNAKPTAVCQFEDGKWKPMDDRVETPPTEPEKKTGAEK